MSRFIVLLANFMSMPICRRIGLAKILSFFIRLVFACQISPGAKFGTGVKLGYSGLGTVIHGQAVIGKGVTIGSNVTIGGNFGNGVPNIGNYVYIATGARLLGGINIGEGSIIGANSVVLKDVEPYSIYAGAPARFIRKVHE